MAILPILTAPNPLLKRVCQSVVNVDDETRQLMDDMLETMYSADGIGLAAAQVGVDKRVVVMDISNRDAAYPKPLKMANPDIIWASEELAPYEEGCLSVPGQFAEVWRPAEVKLTYLDEHNQKQEMHATGLLATCVQHEIDHINGTLFVDHLSKLKRDIILKRLEKEKRQTATL